MIFRDDDEGHFSLKINIVDEDGQPVVPPIEGGLEVKIPEDSSFLTRNGVFNLQHLKFDRPGFYSVDVAINGRTVTGIPFRIVQFHPPGADPQGSM